MKRSYILISILVMSSLGLGWLYWQDPVQFRQNFSLVELFESPQGKPASKDNNYITHIALSPVDKQFPNVLQTAPENMLNAVQTAYRLSPDNRLLLAVGEIYFLYTGQEPAKAVAEYRGSGWRIRYQNQEVGTLPELPDFPDFMKLLSQWSRQLNEQYPLNLKESQNESWKQSVTGQLDRILLPHVLSALKEIDSQWQQGQRDPALLSLAARGLALMTLQSSDRMEILDPLPAKALAMLAMARSMTRQDMDWEESLLAEVMDYSAHAIRFAKKLSSSDPLRHYVNRNDPRLKSLAESENADRFPRYLWLLRLAKREDLQGWYQWLNTGFGDDSVSLPLLKSGLDIESFFTTRNFSREVQQVVLLDLEREIHGPSKKDPGLEIRHFLSNSKYYTVLNGLLGLDNPTIIELMERMESRLETLEQKHKGPFLTANVYNSYFSAFFYTTMYIEGLYNLDSLASPQGTEEFQAQLKGRIEVAIRRVKALFKVLKDNVSTLKGAGPLSTGSFWDFKNQTNKEPDRIDEFVIWYNHLAESEFGTPSVQHLADDIINLKTFGAYPLYRSFQEAKRYFKPTDTAWFIALKRMAYRMDTRPFHRNLLGQMSLWYLNDLKLSEKLYQSIVATSPSHYDATVAKYAHYKNDKKMLARLMDNPSIKMETRSKVVDYLAEQKSVKPKFIFKQYEKLIRENPDDWDVSYDYAKYLNKNKKYSKARKVTRSWLKREVPTPGLEWNVSKDFIAKTYNEEGRYKEALQAVPDSYKGSSLSLRGELLEKLGRLEEAEKVFRILQTRYPSDFSSGLPLVKFLWGRGRYSEAGDLVLKSNYTISQYRWRFRFCPAFVEVFADKPREEALKALAPFIQAKLYFDKLNRISYLLVKEKKYELAFEIGKAIVQIPSNKSYIAVHYFEDYKNWKGEKAALAWARTLIPEGRRDASSQYIYQTEEFGLLWSLVEKPKIEYAWLMRAAASLQYKGLKKKDRKQLIQYYKSAKGDWDLAGKYLLGMVSQEEVIKRSKPAFTRGVYAFYLGLKAETEGRLEEASDWYRVSMETGWYQVAEYHWAVQKLEEWENQSRFLAHLDLK